MNLALDHRSAPTGRSLFVLALGAAIVVIYAVVLVELARLILR